MEAAGKSEKKKKKESRKIPDKVSVEESNLYLFSPSEHIEEGHYLCPGEVQWVISLSREQDLQSSTHTLYLREQGKGSLL